MEKPILIVEVKLIKDIDGDVDEEMMVINLLNCNPEYFIHVDYFVTEQVIGLSKTCRHIIVTKDNVTRTVDCRIKEGKIVIKHDGEPDDFFMEGDENHFIFQLI